MNDKFNVHNIYSKKEHLVLIIFWEDSGPPQVGDPFYETQENHILIGVANIYLECLFHDVTLDYKVPIISQQGDVAGKLHIEISKAGGAILERLMDLTSEENEEETNVHMGAPLLIQLRADSINDLSMDDHKSRNFPARPNFLSLRNSNRSSPKTKSASGKQSPMAAGGGAGKLKPMSTLMEEQHHREIKPLLLQESEEELEEEEFVPPHPKPHAARQLIEADTQSIDSDDFQEFESYQTQQLKEPSSKESTGPPAAATVACTAITPSSTADSLVKGYTPSMTSSGYGSQAVSTLTLSSDDSISVKSMEEPSEGPTATAAKVAPQANSLKRASTGASTDSDAEDGHGERTDDALIEEEEDEGGEEVKDGEVTVEEVKDAAAAAGSKAVSEDGKESSSAKSAEGSIAVSSGDSASANSGAPAAADPNPDSTAPAVSMTEADSDPYSETAMEELERLGEEGEGEEGEGEEGEGDLSSISETSVSGTKSTLSQPKSKKPAFDASTPNDEKKGGSAAKAGSGKKRGGSSGIRPRPMSMVVSPQAEVTTRAWQDDINRRSSLNLSNYSLSAMEDNMSECSFGSRADLDVMVDSPVPGWVQEGEGVVVLSTRAPSKAGVVRFLGNTSFAPGTWVGVELDQPEV
ncbi:hypothetical protein ACOMHN_022070 [Nucella lapillus]